MQFLRPSVRNTINLTKSQFRGFAMSRAVDAKTLVFLEHKGSKLSAASLSAISAAKKLGGEYNGLLVGEASSLEAPAKEAQKYGFTTVLTRSDPSFEHYLPEPLAPEIAALAKDYTHVVGAHTAVAKNVLPRVSALLDVQAVSDVLDVEGEDVFIRPIYAGNAISTVKSKEPIKLFTVRASAWEAAAAGSESGSVDAKAAENKGPTPTEFVSEELVKSERPELGSASVVVSGGRALKSKENFDSLMLPLADAFGAAIGASRAAVDSGYADNALQVGQTGSVVAPSLYIAVGISGAIQHLAGMKDSKFIAAINKDPEAPIFQLADAGLVADLFDAVPELTEKVNAAKA